MAFKKGEGGRPKGAENKVTREIRDVTEGLFDAAYWAQMKQRLRTGRVAPAVEAKLLAYRYGEPRQHVDVQGEVNIRTIVKHVYEAQA